MNILNRFPAFVQKCCRLLSWISELCRAIWYCYLSGLHSRKHINAFVHRKFWFSPKILMYLKTFDNAVFGYWWNYKVDFKINLKTLVLRYLIINYLCNSNYNSKYQWTTYQTYISRLEINLDRFFFFIHEHFLEGGYFKCLFVGKCVKQIRYDYNVDYILTLIFSIL